MLLNKKDLEKALALLSAPVYVPGTVENVTRFVRYEGGAVTLDGGNTELPPKDMLFPGTQKMYAYRLGNEPGVKEFTDDADRIVIGVRPCDIRSMERLDRVFLQEPSDGLYAERRAHTTLVALACKTPGKNCFCDSMGGSPNDAPGADMLMIDAGESYGLIAQSEKGEALLNVWKPLISDGEAKTPDAACTLKVPAEGIAKKLADKFNDPVFAELSHACLGCGTCSFVCPTCYCFDLCDEVKGAEGTKFRCWDSCMFSDYTRMAGGADPRPTKKERLRNRYLHKLRYFNEQFGESLCVGCGRCIDKCPAHLDITDFINRMGGNEV